MKIFALTCFVICLITVLSLQVESFENHEGKPTPKKGATKKGAANGLALCKKVKFDAKKNTISAECKAKKAKKAVKATIKLSACKKIKTTKSCKLSKKNVLSCKGKKKATNDLTKLIKFDGKKLVC